MPYKDKQQRNQRDRERWLERRQQWFEQNGPCVDCGSWKDLQLDHVHSETKISHRIWNWAEERRKDELEKCVARCIICHIEKSKNEAAKGEQKKNAKLTEQNVLDIRESVKSLEQLAMDYKVHKETIRKIITRQRWKHI